MSSFCSSQPDRPVVCYDVELWFCALCVCVFLWLGDRRAPSSSCKGQRTHRRRRAIARHAPTLHRLQNTHTLPFIQTHTHTLIQIIHTIFILYIYTYTRLSHSTAICVKRAASVDDGCAHTLHTLSSECAS